MFTLQQKIDRLRTAKARWIWCQANGTPTERSEAQADLEDAKRDCLSHNKCKEPDEIL
jgi:hypothetical protein